MQRVPAAVAALAVAVLATSCARPVAGAPITSDEGVRRAMEQRFNAIIDKVEGYITNTKSATSEQTWKATVNEETHEKKTTYAFHGEPPTSVVHRDPDNPATNVTIFEPAGSGSTYYLLGERYRSLAPTPWVAVPDSESKWTEGMPCLVSGKNSLCNIVSAVHATLDDPPPNISKIAYTNEDGSVSLLTNTTVQKFIESNLIIFPEGIEERLSPVILNSLLSIRIDLDNQNRIRLARIKGAVDRAGKKFSVDLQHKITGPATPGDFPPTPSGAELTRITDRQKAKAFEDKAQGSPPGG